MDYNKSKAPNNTITRDMNQMSQPIGNVYETVAIISKRANEISQDLKSEIDKKIKEVASSQDNIDEMFENREQINASRQFELLPKPALLATEEFINDELIIRNSSKDRKQEL